MKVAIFLAKLAMFLSRSAQSDDLPRLSHRRIPVLEDLKREFHRLHMIELRRVRLAEFFKESRIHEVTHRKAVNRKIFRLNRVAHLVSVKHALAVMTPKIVSRIDQQLCKLM